MSIRLRGKRISAEVRAFVRWLETVVDVRHDLDLYITPRLYGYFDSPQRGFAPYIVASMDDDWRDTIAHECAHYEQWRDGREQNERGVKQRARALVKRYRKEAA